MKNNYWVILGAMLSTSLLAQQATNPAPAAPISTPAAAPAATIAAPVTKTNAPAAPTAKKKASKKKTTEKQAPKAPQKKAVTKKKEPVAELKTVPLIAGPAIVVASNVNVRGQAKLKSEVVTKITKGDSVTVLEEIVKNNSGPDEPSAWAKIVLPPKARAWVNTSFINASSQTVLPKKLNVRSGAGENYSVIGLMKRGDAVKVVNTKGEWTEIEPPAGAYAFVAAQYLKQEAPEKPAPPPPPVEPPPTAATVAAAPPVAPPPTEAPVVPPSAETPAAPAAQTPAITTVAPPPPAPEIAPIEEPPPPRIVQREGIVRGMTSIQAPSRFALISPENGKNMDYLFTTSKNLDLRRYKGLRIIVTGEESLDERWGNTPVITIQKIQVVQ